MNAFDCTHVSVMQGEGAAVVNTVDTMIKCFDLGGCAVVPGLPENQYELTLITSLIGGCVFGFSTTLRPQGKLVIES